jgi:myosin heavy subunit
MNSAEVDKFGVAEKFFYDVSKIDHYSDRLNAFHFMVSFQEYYNDMFEMIKWLQKASDVTVNNEKFKGILQIILALGNYMNSNNRGGAYGFELTSILKLNDTKTCNNQLKYNLMNYLSQLVDRKFPGLSDFADEMESVKDGEKVNIATVRSLMVMLKSSLKQTECLHKILKRKKAREEEKGDESIDEDNFVERLDGFIENARKKFETLEALLKEAEEQFNKAVKLYGEDPKITPEEFFGVFSQFITRYKDATKENEEEEKKKREKERKEMEKKLKLEKRKMLQEKKLKQKQLKEQTLAITETPNSKKVEAKSTKVMEQSISAKQVATDTKKEVSHSEIKTEDKNISTTKTEVTEESESTITTTTTTTITTTVTTKKKMTSSKIITSSIEGKEGTTKKIEAVENPTIKISPPSSKMLIKDHHIDTPTTAINEVDESLSELLKITQHHIKSIHRSDAKRLRAQSVPVPMLLSEEDEDDEEEEDKTFLDNFSSEEEIIQNIRQNNPSIVEGKIDNIINNIRKGKFSDEVNRRKGSDSDKTVKFEEEEKSVKDDDETLKEDVSEKSDELVLLKNVKSKLPVDRFPETLLKRVDSKIDALDYQITIGVN